MSPSGKPWCGSAECFIYQRQTQGDRRGGEAGHYFCRYLHSFNETGASNRPVNSACPGKRHGSTRAVLVEHTCRNNVHAPFFIRRDRIEMAIGPLRAICLTYAYYYAETVADLRKHAERVYANYEVRLSSVGLSTFANFFERLRPGLTFRMQHGRGSERKGNPPRRSIVGVGEKVPTLEELHERGK